MKKKTALKLIDKITDLQMKFDDTVNPTYESGYLSCISDVVEIIEKQCK